MIVIADSGSTKTDWRIIYGPGRIEQVEGLGLNPNFHTPKNFLQTIIDTLSKYEGVEEAKHIYFYGAGCFTVDKNTMVKNSLAEFFKVGKIQVYHDLLGAARAACLKKEGITAILGTGSNSCSFNGKEIIQNFPSGGFIIGDEGGGVNIGRRVLKSFIEGYMPNELRERFEFQYRLSIDDILRNLYENKYPNRFMASFSHFAHRHKENPFMAQQIIQEFESFFDHQILRFSQAKEWPLNAVGSIAYYYHEYLEVVAESRGVKIGNIIEKPIAALSLYHVHELAEQ